MASALYALSACSSPPGGCARPDPEAVTEAAQATALAQSGKYDTAIQHYQKAIRLDPTCRVSI